MNDTSAHQRNFYRIEEAESPTTESKASHAPLTRITPDLRAFRDGCWSLMGPAISDPRTITRIQPTCLYGGRRIRARSRAHFSLLPSH